MMDGWESVAAFPGIMKKTESHGFRGLLADGEGHRCAHERSPSPVHQLAHRPVVAVDEEPLAIGACQRYVLHRAYLLIFEARSSAPRPSTGS